MYLIVSKVKSRAKEAGKRVGVDFLARFNAFIDRKLGGDVVLLPYHLRRSILRYATYRQRIVTQLELAAGYTVVGEV